jgi:hypothetical protein
MYLFKMGIWTQSLKFNVCSSGIHQLPQTTGDGIHSFLQEVVWDIGDNVPNLVLQLFHFARFCTVHLLICPAPQEEVTEREIWTSSRPFVTSSSSQPTSRKLLIQKGTYAKGKVWPCPNHRRANYKILFRDAYIRINFIMIALILQIL